MDELSAGELRTMLEVVAELHRCADVAQMTAMLLRSLNTLVPCDLISYNEIDFTGGATRTLFEPELVPRAEVEEAFARLLHQHPLVADFIATEDPAPRRMSDFISLRALQSLDLYHEVFRPLETNHQLAFSVSTAPNGVVGIGLNRWRRDFDEHDLAVISALQPHISLAFDHAQLRAGAVARPHVALPSGASKLTTREHEVLVLVRQGASNRVIARTLFVSERTAEKHVANMLAKLGVATRVAAILLPPEG